MPPDPSRKEPPARVPDPPPAGPDRLLSLRPGPGRPLPALDHRCRLAHLDRAGPGPHQGPHARPPHRPPPLTPAPVRKEPPITAALLVPVTAADITPAETVPDATVHVPHPYFAARRELEATFGTWLDSLNLDRLSALSALCEERMAGRFSSRLLETVRWEAALAVATGDTWSRSPVTTVRFGAGTWENGVFYSETSAEFVHADGTISALDCGDKVAEHLADLSAVNHPDTSDTLIVDLVTGRITS